MYTTITVTVTKDASGDADAVTKSARIDFSAVAHAKYPAADSAASIIRRLVVDAYEAREKVDAEN